MTVALTIVVALASMGALFAGVFVLARRIDNYGIVDIAWSYAFGLLALVYAATGPAWAVRRWLLTVLVVGWSARLGTHLWRRVLRHHPVEDGRYAAMRRSWARNFGFRMFLFFQLQAVSVVVLGLPFLLAARNDAVGFHPLEWAGMIVWLVGVCGEALADRQLNRFKRLATSRDGVCELGLWRYSRHPNYFFEWLTWVGFALFAAAAPWGWAGFIAPAAILFLLLRVTGIPATEEQALRTKGERYRDYQQTTSAFIPWPRKKATPGTALPSSAPACPEPTGSS